MFKDIEVNTMAQIKLIAMVLSYTITLGSCANILDQLGKELESGVHVVKQPITETVTYIGSSQCSKVKKIVGVTYEQLEGEREPDLNTLALELRTKAEQKRYPISEAQRLIPKARFYSQNKQFVIFIHGFTDDPSKGSFQNISAALLERGGYNVIALDGSSFIKWLYLRSTTYVRFMGEKLGEVLAELRRGNILDSKNIHIVGHSLGSHIASFTGKMYTNITGEKVERITALDPAGPCFSNIDEELKLNKNDAAYVDVIHSDAGVYGLKESLGHVDFWPNGGSLQPDCLFQTCSHSRAWVYFAESVLNEKGFIAKGCKNWKTFQDNKCGKTPTNFMGFGSDPEIMGDFYLVTNGNPPYAKNKEGLKFKDETIIGSISRKITPFNIQK